MIDYIYVSVSTAVSAPSKKAYIAEMAPSNVFETPKDGKIPPERIKTLSQIYDAVHRPFWAIVEASGLTHRSFSERFCIPLRTIENWVSAVRVCPIYTSLMIQELLGLLHR